MASCVLGIDPGLTRTGWGVVQHASGRLRCVANGTISTKPADPSEHRLRHLLAEITGVIDGHDIASVALERLFLKGNAKTAVDAIRASGVVMAAAAARGLDVSEYTPAQVKHSVVGVGSATKEQVAFMLGRIVAFPDGARPSSADAADAVAVAVTHLHSANPWAVAR